MLYGEITQFIFAGVNNYRVFTSKELLKMSFKCSININQQSKDEPLICAISGVANDHVNVFFQDRPIIIIIFFLIT